MQKDYFNVSGSGRFDFIGKTKGLVFISVIAVIASFVIAGVKGFNYGIDFAGGTEIQIQFEKDIGADELRKFLEGIQVNDAQIQKFDETNEYMIRFQLPEAQTTEETNRILSEKVQAINTGLKTQFADANPDIRRVDTVGPQIGDQLKKDSILAVFYALLMILVYIGLRFDYIFAPGAVICLFHDVVVTMGVIALLGKEVNVQILAAVLTIVGYSLNDTIVIFDRVRENAGLYADKSLPWIINKSMNECLSRTIVTSGLTLISTLCLYIFADGAIKDFAFAMSIGVVAGSYSTIYIASPMVILCDILQRRKKA